MSSIRIVYSNYFLPLKIIQLLHKITWDIFKNYSLLLLLSTVANIHITRTVVLRNSPIVFLAYTLHYTFQPTVLKDLPYKFAIFRRLRTKIRRCRLRPLLSHHNRSTICGWVPNKTINTLCVKNDYVNIIISLHLGLGA